MDIAKMNKLIVALALTATPASGFGAMGSADVWTVTLFSGGALSFSGLGPGLASMFSSLDQ